MFHPQALKNWLKFSPNGSRIMFQWVTNVRAIFCIVNVKNSLSCENTVTVCIHVGCFRGACIPCLSFLFKKEIFQSVPCSSLTSLFNGFRLFLSFCEPPVPPSDPCSWSIFSVCEWPVLAWDTFSVHTSLNPCATAQLLCHFVQILQVNDAKLLEPLFFRCVIVMPFADTCLPVADVWSNNPKWLYPTE